MPINTLSVAHGVKTMQGLGWQARVNALDGTLEIRPGFNKPWQGITEAMLAHFRHTARSNGITTWSHAYDGILSEAQAQPWNPLMEYLNSTRYDGGQHIKKLSAYIDELPIIDCNGLQQFVFERFFTRWLVGAVRRAVESTGAQNRMLVLDAAQGAGKSEFTRWLCPESLRERHFYEGAIIPDNNDHRRRLLTTWLWEVSELGSTTRKADVESLKAFLTLQNITIRLPYGHSDSHGAARTNFIGTINATGAGVLNDVTGNRRFMFVKIDNINWDYSRGIDINQVWGEAYYLYLQGYAPELDREETDLANLYNSKYEAENPLDDLVDKYYQIDPTQLNWFTPTIDIEDRIRDEYPGARLTLRRELNTVLVLRGCEKARQRRAGGGNPERGFLGVRVKP